MRTHGRIHLQDSHGASITRSSNADPAILGKYVLALLNADKGAEDLLASCQNQLEVFLSDATDDFVDDLFWHLKQNGMHSACMWNQVRIWLGHEYEKLGDIALRMYHQFERLLVFVADGDCCFAEPDLLEEPKAEGAGSRRGMHTLVGWTCMQLIQPGYVL